MNKALIIIDMLNDFCNPSGALYVGKQIEPVILNIKKLQEEYRTNKQPIFYICDSHLPTDLEFKMFPPHAVKGTSGSNVIEELSPIEPMTQLEPKNLVDRLAKKEILIPKTRYSGFYDTDLDQQLKLRNISHLDIVGVCSDICVLHTCADARNRDYVVSVFENAIMSFDEEKHKFAIDHMQKILGVNIL